MLRGGSWMDVPPTSTSGTRLAHGPTDRSFINVGFRVALSVEAVKLALGKPVQAEKPLEAEVPRKASNDQSALTLKGSPFTSVAYSPDGKWIATAAINRSVTLWDAEKAQPVRTLQGGWCVAFGPDSQRLASAGPENSVRTWNVSTGEETQTLKGHTGDVRSVTFSRDGKHIASASADKTVRLWDAKTGQLLKTFVGHIDDVRAVAFSPDGMLLASAGKDLRLKVWSLPGTPPAPGEAFSSAEGPVRERTSHGAQAEIRSLVFTADGTRVLSAGHDRVVRTWSSQAEVAGRAVGLEHASGIMSLSLSPDGQWIALAGCDRTVTVSNAAGGSTQLVLEGHASQVTGVAWHPNGKRVASVSYDGTLKLWDVAEGLSKPLSLTSERKPTMREVSEEEAELIAAAEKTSRPLTNGNFESAISGWTLEDGADQFGYMALGGQHPSLVTGSSQRESKTGRLYQCFKVPMDATELRFSPHGGADSQATYVALWNGPQHFRRTAGRNDHIPVDVAWNIESLRGQVVTLEVVDQSTAPWGFIGVHGFELLTQQAAAASPRKPATRVTQAVQEDPLTFSLRGHGYPVVGLAVSPDGKLLASGDLEGTVLVWNVADRKLKFEIARSGVANVTGLAFSPDGKLLATAFGPLLRVHDATNGHELKTLTGHSGLIWRVSFSPDSKQLASSSQDKTVKVWDVAQGKVLTTLTGQDRAFLSVAFSPDGKWLAGSTSFGESYVMLWDTNSWKESQRLSPINGQVWSIAFSPDSQRLVTANDSGRAAIWDVQSGDELLSLHDRKGQQGRDHMQNYLAKQMRSVAFNHDGSRIVTAADSGVIKIWDATTGQKLHELSGHAKDARGATFSPDGKWVATGGGDHLVKGWTLDGLPIEESTDDTIIRPLVDVKAVAEEIKSLQGTWRMTNLADYAQLLQAEVALKELHLIVNGETAMLVAPRLASGFAITLDPARSPKACDLRMIDTDTGDGLWKGSYKLEGDSLVVTTQDEKFSRPIEFVAPRFDPDNHQMPPLLFKFEREKTPLAQADSIIDLSAWQRASKRLRKFNVTAHLGNMSRVRQHEINLPAYVGYFDLGPVMTGDTVSTDVWDAVSSVNVVACSVKEPSDATLRQLTTHRGLMGLTLRGRSTVTKDGFALLKNCPRFVSLSLVESPQTIDMLNAVPATTDLRLLEIHGPSASPALVAAITRFKNLEALTLIDLDLSDGIALELAKLSHLKQLTSGKTRQPNVDKPELSDKGLQALESLPRLRLLELSGHGLDADKLREINQKLRSRQ